MAIPVPAAEREPALSTEGNLSLIIDQDSPLSALSTQELLFKAHELRNSDEADSSLCLGVAGQILTDYGTAVAPEIKTELMGQIEQNYPNSEELPKAPNQRSHPSMAAADRANFQQTHKNTVDASRKGVLEEVGFHDPLSEIDVSSLITSNRLMTSIGEIKKEFREQAGNHAHRVIELNPSLIPRGRIRRSASWVVGKFGIQEPPSDVSVNQGSEEDLRDTLIELIETLEMVRNPEIIGQLAASEHIENIAGKIKVRLSHRYEGINKVAKEKLEDELFSLLDRADQLSNGRIRTKRQRKSGKEEILEADEKNTANVQRIAVQQGVSRNLPRVDLPSGLSSERIVGSLKKLGFVKLASRGKGSHRVLFNPETNATVIISDKVGTALLKAILKQASVSALEFRDSL